MKMKKTLFLSLFAIVSLCSGSAHEATPMEVQAPLMIQCYSGEVADGEPFECPDDFKKQAHVLRDISEGTDSQEAVPVQCPRLLFENLITFYRNNPNDWNDSFYTTEGMPQESDTIVHLLHTAFSIGLQPILLKKLVEYYKERIHSNFFYEQFLKGKQSYCKLVGLIDGEKLLPAVPIPLYGANLKTKLTVIPEYQRPLVEKISAQRTYKALQKDATTFEITQYNEKTTSYDIPITTVRLSLEQRIPNPFFTANEKFFVIKEDILDDSNNEKTRLIMVNLENNSTSFFNFQGLVSIEATTPQVGEEKSYVIGYSSGKNLYYFLFDCATQSIVYQTQPHLISCAIAEKTNFIISHCRDKKNQIYTVSIYNIETNEEQKNIITEPVDVIELHLSPNQQYVTACFGKGTYFYLIDLKHNTSQRISTQLNFPLVTWDSRSEYIITQDNWAQMSTEDLSPSLFITDVKTMETKYLGDLLGAAGVDSKAPISPLQKYALAISESNKDCFEQCFNLKNRKEVTSIRKKYTVVKIHFTKEEKILTWSPFYDFLIQDRGTEEERINGTFPVGILDPATGALLAQATYYSPSYAKASDYRFLRIEDDGLSCQIRTLNENLWLRVKLPFEPMASFSNSYALLAFASTSHSEKVSPKIKEYIGHILDKHPTLKPYLDHRL